MLDDIACYTTKRLNTTISSNCVLGVSSYRAVLLISTFQAVLALWIYKVFVHYSKSRLGRNLCLGYIQGKSKQKPQIGVVNEVIETLTE